MQHTVGARAIEEWARLEEEKEALQELDLWARFCAFLHTRPYHAAVRREIPPEFLPLIGPATRRRRRELRLVFFSIGWGWRVEENWQRRLRVHMEHVSPGILARPAEGEGTACRIYLHCEVERGRPVGNYRGRALTGTGELIATELTDSPPRVQAALSHPSLLAEYGKRYPQGYEVVWTMTGDIYQARNVGGTWELAPATGEA